VDARRVLRRRGAHIFYIIGSQLAVRLSASLAGRPLPAERFLVLISVRGWVDPGAIVRLEGLSQLQNPMPLPEIETTTFRLVAWWILLHWEINSNIFYKHAHWIFAIMNYAWNKRWLNLSGRVHLPRIQVSGLQWVILKFRVHHPFATPVSSWNAAKWREENQHISLPTLHWQPGWLLAEGLRSGLRTIEGEENFLFTIRVHLVLR
jgi:hypothetical protein